MRLIRKQSPVEVGAYSLELLRMRKWHCGFLIADVPMTAVVPVLFLYINYLVLKTVNLHANSQRRLKGLCVSLGILKFKAKQPWTGW